MSSAIPTTPVSSKQAATGRASVRTLDAQYELMLWTSTGTGNPICFGVSKTGSHEPKVHQTKAAGRPGAGPAFILMSSGTTGYLIWANAKQQICVSAATASAKSPPVWSLSGNTLTITASKAAGGPAAALQMQNGQLVLVIVWQDVGAGSMVYTQIAPGTLAAGTQPAFDRLGDSCLDTPCLARLGAASALAYTDASGAFNLAVDVAGGVDFDFGRRFTTSAISSVYGPAFVPLSRDQAYVFWGTSAALNYQQIGIDSDGDWQLNGWEGCSGSFTGIVPSAAPSAHLSSAAVNGVTAPFIVVAAPSSTASPAGTVLVAGIEPDRSPLPLPQLQLVTS